MMPPREQLTLAAVSGAGFLQVKGIVETLLASLHVEEPLAVSDFHHDLLIPALAS